MSTPRRPDAFAAFLHDEVVLRALREDVRGGDITSEALVPAGAQGRATMVTRVAAVACGLALARRAFELVDPAVVFDAEVEDGTQVAPGAFLATVSGSLRAILAAERTALNFVQRCSGIATATRECVEAVRDLGVAILDTRKTAPGLREVDKMAVRVGGGTNHRTALDDMILVKDNHLAAVGSLREAVDRALGRAGHARLVEVEVASLQQLDELLGLPRLPDAVLLDNFTPAQVKQAVERVGGRLTIEVSGGVTRETLRAYAEAGPDAISLGALTHSVRAADIALEVEPSS